MKRLAILGSTGSIGQSTLDVVRAHPDKLKVVALAAGSNAGRLREQADAFGVQITAKKHWSGRLEAALSDGHNPFTGKHSFRALSGPTIDEPTKIDRTDFRFAIVYHFGKPPMPNAMSKPIDPVEIDSMDSIALSPNFITAPLP